MNLKTEPLTRENWKDFELLFGDNGACGGCWCTHWRLLKKEHDAGKTGGNKLHMKSLVDDGRVTGLLGFLDNKAVGWVSIEPRSEFIGLSRSRVLKPVDDKNAWAISCFFIDKDHRMQGVSRALIEGCKEYVKSQGGGIIEGYPVESRNKKSPPVFVWTGLYAAYKSCGFEEVARRSETRPIMRFEVS